MKSRSKIAILVWVVLWTTGCALAQQVIIENFEGDLSAWTVGTDLPDDPNNPGHKVASEAVVSPEKVFAGNQSLKLYIDGRQDDGTIWIARQIELSKTDTMEVELNFRFWSPFKDSMNNLAYVVAYIGPQEPKVERDLPRLAPVTQVGEWDLLTLSAPVPPGKKGWVAVGFSVVWESEQTYYLDNVAVKIHPRGSTPVGSSPWGKIKRLLRLHRI